MKNKLTISVFVAQLFILISIPVNAKWFLRATANSWSTSQMAQTSPSTFSICQKFNNGDDNGPARFKIDRDGDWLYSYPDSDYVVSPNHYHQIEFDSENNNLSVNQVADCDTDVTLEQNFSSLYFRGTANSWETTMMSLVADNSWQLKVNFDGQSGQRFKLDVSNNWSQNYGDSDVNGQLELNGNDIFTNVVGEYLVTVNDISLTYNITKVSPTENKPPTAIISPQDKTQVFVGDKVQFDALSSFDEDSSVLEYLWSNGESAAVIELMFDTIGVETIGLVVTDNHGNSDQVSLSITVEANPVLTDSWFFRGTSNSWDKDIMSSDDGLNFCTRQLFVIGDNNGGPRFKIDHFGDWLESYPAQDFSVDPNSHYEICFNNLSHSISLKKLNEVDVQPPQTVVDPPAGHYPSTLSILLSATDNQDSQPKIYYTLDNSTPTINSSLYQGEALTASDLTTGVDLVIRTLTIDSSNNQNEQQFSYFVDANNGLTNDFREETIYFLMTARFYDGDTSNNYYNRDRIKEGDPQWRGDFKGLIQQLDYIKDLGFSAIWITPPVENRSGLDYHGYHAYDWMKVDPRLESEGASYQDLIDQAHQRGLKIIQDVVINHSSQYGIRDKVWIDHLPIKYYVPQGKVQGDIINSPYLGNLGDYLSINRDDNDNSVAPLWFRERHQSDPEGIIPLVDPQSGVSVPLAGYNPNRFFGINAQGLDSQWYHLDGFMAGGDWENPTALQRKHMAGDTIDLATEKQNVKDYLNNAIKMYLDMGVDAIRLDTAKHIERDELLSYTHQWQNHKPGLFVFGEVLVKGMGFGSELANDNATATIRPWWYTRTGHDPSKPEGHSNFSVIDFPLFSTFRDNVTRGTFSGIKSVLDMDWTYADPTQLVTFFQNHDVGPDNDFKYRYCCSQENAALVYNLLWTIRGIPTLYYGEEIMFMAGAPQDIQSSNDTIDSTGRAYYGPHLNDKNTTTNHLLYQHIKRLNQLRHAIPALQKGEMSQLNEWGSGMSFIREYESSYALIGLAASNGQQVTFSGIKNGTYHDAVSGQVLTVSNGNIQFYVNPFSAGIYVLNGPGKIGETGTYLK